MGKIRANLLARVKSNDKSKSIPKILLQDKTKTENPLTSPIVSSWSQSSTKPRLEDGRFNINSNNLGKITKVKDKSRRLGQRQQVKQDKDKKVRFSPRVTISAGDDEGGSGNGNRKSFFDTQSATTGLSTSSPRTILKAIKTNVKDKKIRQKLKREAFRKKIELIKAAEKQKKETEQRKKTVIVGDLNPLLQALDTLEAEDSNMKSKDNQVLSKVQDKGIQKKSKKVKIKMKKRQTEIAQGLEYFAIGLGLKKD